MKSRLHVELTTSLPPQIIEKLSATLMWRTAHLLKEIDDDRKQAMITLGLIIRLADDLSAETATNIMTTSGVTLREARMLVKVARHASAWETWRHSQMSLESVCENINRQEELKTIPQAAR